MRTIKKLAVAITALVLTTVALSAAPWPCGPYIYHSVQGTNIVAGTAYAIISGASVSGGPPCVTSISCDADTVGAYLQSYRVVTNVVADRASVTTAVSVPQTNGFTATAQGFGWTSGNIIIIEHKKNCFFERRVISSFISSTNLTLGNAPEYAVQPGDIIWACVTNGAPRIILATQQGYASAGGAITNFYTSATALLCGQTGAPLLIDLVAPTTAHLWNVTARYPTQ